MKLSNNDLPGYVNLSTQLSNLNQTLCSNQTSFALWMSEQNSCLPNSVSFFQSWLQELLSTSSQPNIDGPNDLTWGPIYKTFIFPLLEIVGIWNQIFYLCQCVPIQFYPSFLQWWNVTCTNQAAGCCNLPVTCGADSGCGFCNALNAFLPFNITISPGSGSVSIGKATNPAAVAKNLFSLCQNYSAANIYNNAGICEWNEEIYQQAWISVGKTPPTLNYNCTPNGCQSSCNCTTSVTPAAPPGCVTCIQTILLLTNLGQLIDTYPGQNPAILRNLSGAANSITVSSDGQYGYVSLMSQFSIIEIASGQVVKQFSASNQLPVFMFSSVLSPDESQIYVTGYVFKQNVGYYFAVVVIDASTYSYNYYVSNFSSGVPVARFASSSVITPDGQFVYFNNQANPSSSTVIFNTTTKTFMQPIRSTTLTPGNGTLVISPDGRYVYGSIPYANGVSIIDTSTNQLLPNPIITQVNPLDINSTMAISPDGQTLYVCAVGYESNGIQVVNLSTGGVSSISYPNSGPQSITITSDGNYIYTYDYSGNLTKIDRASRQILSQSPSPVMGTVVGINSVLIGQCNQ